MYEKKFNYEKKASYGPFVKELPESERPREKIMAKGVGSLSNAELLAVLISSGTEKESAITVASRILAMESGSLQSLSDYHPEEFMKIPGIGVAKACTLAAALELGRRVASSPRPKSPKIETPAQAAALFMEELRYLKKETFMTALLNVKGELIQKDSVSVGGLSSSSAMPREVFACAVRRGAGSVILVHNHPSGDPSPSEADIRITKQLVSAGEVLGITVSDHIIIGDGRYFSMAAEKLL
ncbi:MAG: DNA repair protein RadC [Clostridia bacterium]|nr:DNA repair protein RadC [Clostridia bacterium]